VNEKSIMEIWTSIKDEVLEYLKDIEFLSLLAHGSFAEDFANKTSDFDLLVVCAENVQEREDVLVINNIEVNIEIFHKKTIEKQIRSLEKLLGPRKLGFKIPIACRLKHAVILVDKENNGKNLVEMINRFQLSKQVMDWYSKCGLNYYYDAVGTMANGDYATSVHMARIGALHVITGILLAQGELYVKKKWFIKLIDKISFSNKEQFLELMGLCNVDKKQAKQSIQNFKNLITEFERLREQNIK
jgi:hypothetical protein